jgi:hypothetical protein
MHCDRVKNTGIFDCWSTASGKLCRSKTMSLVVAILFLGIRDQRSGPTDEKSPIPRSEGYLWLTMT